MNAAPAVRVEFCLGSACFARGNRAALALVKRHVEENRLQDRVVLQGALCTENCPGGPVVTINGRQYRRVDGPALVEIIRHLLAGDPA